MAGAVVLAAIVESNPALRAEELKRRTVVDVTAGSSSGPVLGGLSSAGLGFVMNTGRIFTELSFISAALSSSKYPPAEPIVMRK
jgi:hypothetical protein